MEKTAVIQPDSRCGFRRLAPIRMPDRRRHALMRNCSALLIVLAAAAASGRADTAISLADELPPSTEPLCGRLSEVQGLPVLELWGTPEQAAFAHGFLLAEPMLLLFDKFLLSPKIMPEPRMYEMLLVPGVRRQFVWSDARQRELAAMTRGLRARLTGDRLNCRALGRPLKIEDLMVGNTLADWFGAMCSSFTVWGDLSADGQTLTARNLGFPSTNVMERLQIVVIRRPHGDTPGWIGVSWPGLIGVYTAMSERGVTMMMHDAGGLPPSAGAGFTPRSLILHEALEAARPTTFVDDILNVFQKRLVLVGNNIHVSAPLTPGVAPAAIFEYDANAAGKGVAWRSCQSKGAAAISGLWCTNHMRLRKAPRECWRYKRLSDALTGLAAAGGKLTPTAALELVRSVRQDITLHTVCFIPHRKIMLASIPAVSAATVEFDLVHWLKRPVGVSVDDDIRKDQP